MDGENQRTERGVWGYWMPGHVTGHVRAVWVRLLGIACSSVPGVSAGGTIKALTSDSWCQKQVFGNPSLGHHLSQ